MFPWTFYAFTETPKSPRYFGWHAIAQQVVNHCAVPWNSREMSVAISYVGIRCDTYDRICVSFLKSCRRREDFHIITAPLLLLRYRSMKRGNFAWIQIFRASRMCNRRWCTSAIRGHIFYYLRDYVYRMSD